MLFGRLKGRAADTGQAPGNCYARQASAGGECGLAKVGDVVAERGVGQVLAVIEGIAPDAGHAVRNRQAGETGGIERRVTDARDSVGNRDASQ